MKTNESKRITSIIDHFEMEVNIEAPDKKKENSFLLPSDYLICPKCNRSNTVYIWDWHTKYVAGIKEGAKFLTSGADKSAHLVIQSYFYCPVCNEEIDGVDLIRV